MADVRVVVTGRVGLGLPDPEWPEGWPPPRRGDTVELPGSPPLEVRTVVWYPHGDEHADREPFVYVVVGPPRPKWSDPHWPCRTITAIADALGEPTDD